MAFDRPHYQMLIPNHLRDIAKMPRDVLKFLEWCIVCSITGEHMRSVALDEAHEMLVNKDLKTTIVHRPRGSNLHVVRPAFKSECGAIACVSMQNQGGLRACSPRKILYFTTSETASDSF